VWKVCAGLEKGVKNSIYLYVFIGVSYLGGEGQDDQRP